MKKDKDPEKYERGQWSNKLDVLLSYIGYCVGLGNVWRFPYLCYRNGGGAFLIPYFIVLVLTGLPIYYMEIMLGQFSAEGVTTVWKFAPLFKGIGYTMMMMCTMFCLYYNQLLAYILHFLFSSFTSELPWSTCDNSWNTPLCKPVKAAEGNVNDTISYGNTTTVSSGLTLNLTNITTKLHISPAEEYWERHVLNISDGIGEMGVFEWKLVLLLLLAWIMTFFCLIKGIKSTGKVVYFTATFPYVVIFILLIRGVTLPGSLDGLKFYLIPDFKKLVNTKVWGDAASQIFFSLGQSWGILITYGSYNKFNHRSEKDAVIATAACAFTSLFAGMAVFSVIGFLAHEMGDTIANVMKSGPGLVFVVYPEALSRMPIAPLWAILFFFMLLTVGLDTQFSTFECVLSGLMDEFPATLRKRKLLFTLSCCCIMFLLGLPLAMQGGMYVLNLFDWYSATFPPLLVAMCETILVAYVYGLNRFSNDIEMMTGSRPGLFWKVCWLAVTPVIVAGIIVFQIAIYIPVTFNDYVYPKWAEAVGWCLCAASVAFIPAWMVIQVVRKRPACSASAIFATVRELTRPSFDWGPQEVPATVHAEEMKQLKSDVEPNQNVV